MVGHIPGLLILSDLEPTFCVCILSWQPKGHSSMALAAGLAIGLFGPFGCEGELPLAVRTGEVICGQASMAV